ncbi:MAG: dihydrolipoamide acetyltransferase family protein [Chloroflexota bacterium]
MATAVVMPKQGQSVESCIIVGWKKQVGDSVAQGEILCEVETDKALLEVESPVSGTLLARFFEEEDDVPVLVNIAVVGEPGEAFDALRPDMGDAEVESADSPPSTPKGGEVSELPAAAAVTEETPQDTVVAISPRAKKLAEQKQVALAGIAGSGPNGRIIERDVQLALSQQPAMTPLAKSMVSQGGFESPVRGSGVSGRVMAADLKPLAGETIQPLPTSQQPDEVEIIPVRGVRKVIAERMLESLQTTAQLTLNATADARALLAYRQRLKQSNEALGVQGVTLNDLILFAVARLLPQYPDMNAHFLGDTIVQHRNANLGFAVDTPRGLLVPVIHRANQLTLKQLAQESKRLATAAQAGTISPDDLAGGTFTISNLGSFGVESFTPVLNPPQVGILGVGNINLKPVQGENEVEFIPHIGLSLTINHQAIDGAPAARFLQALGQGIAEFDLLLAG